MKGLALCFVFLFINLYGQHYTSNWYNIDNGLPQSSAKDIIKDKYGFIWITTENGLVRHDGISFITYDKFQVNNLHFGDFIGSPLNDSIIIYNNYEEKKILIKNRYPKVFNEKKETKTLYKDGENFLKRIVKNFVTIKFYPANHHYIQLTSGSYYFHDNYIIYKDKKNIQTKINIPFSSKDLYNLFTSGETLFINDPKQRKTHTLYKGNLASITNPSLLHDPETKIYWHQASDQTFIINKNNIYILENKNGSLDLKFLLNYNDIGNYPFSSIYYDKDFNKLYLGTLNNGLNILQLSPFYVAKKDIDFADNVYYNSLVFGKNTIITEDGTVFNHNGAVEKYPFGNNEKYLIMYDHSENILIKSENQIIKAYKGSQYQKTTSAFIRKGLETFKKSDDLYGYSISDLSMSSLYIFKNDQFKTPDYIYNFKNSVSTFLKHNEHELLVGCIDGLYTASMDKDKKITRIAGKIHVKSIIRTKDNLIWITTNKNGFYLLKNKKLIKMPNDKNNYLESAHYILEDQQGYYWISSNNGLFKVQKKQLLQYAENNQSPVFYYRYTKKDGFLTNEFNGSPGHILENGEFVFPSMDGFVFFTPAAVRTYYPDPKNIYLERAKINNANPIYFHDNLILKNNYKTAAIYIDIPYYSNSDNLYIEAKIEGKSSSKWEPIEIDKERKYIISDLEPGDYTLKIRVLISMEGRYEYRSVKFSIEPLFFQTATFKTIAVILFLLALITIIQVRTNFLRLKNQALKKIVHNKNTELKESSLNLELVKNDLLKESEYQKKLIETISHDITTPIKFIAMLSQKLHDSDDIKLQKKYFDSIHKSSEELYQFTLSLKQYTELYKTKHIYEKEEYFINKILKTKKKLFQEIAKEKNTFFKITGDNEIPCRANQNIIGAIIHNIIDNAVKNTDNGKIILDAQENENTIIITVADSGIGMSSEQIHDYNELFQNPTYENAIFKGRGLGLHMVIQLIKKMNASISFHHNQPEGTLVKITLIKMNTHE